MQFLIRKWLEGIVKRTLQAGIAIVGAAQLSSMGITLNPELLTVTLFGMIEALRSWLKHKVGWKWL